ncbi:MAG: hypothetical protein KAV82_02060, partial [Phycisphaerae bacterium]|nr:hypothetical protein [Phycisphaerae bacterium]
GGSAGKRGGGGRIKVFGGSIEFTGTTAVLAGIGGSGAENGTVCLSSSGDVSPDCNSNGILDQCDIDCGETGGLCDVPGCGASLDCNTNGIPDDCEVPPIGDGPDCNTNGIPDECDPDSDSDGVPDDCDNCPNDHNPEQTDSDGDGMGDACDSCNGCLIDEMCTSNGVPNPANECQYCDIAQSTTSWTNRSSGYACGDQGDTVCDNPNTCDGDGICLPNHADDGTPCDDGLFCNGEETGCQSGICQDGADPCVDQAHCDEDADQCKSLVIFVKASATGANDGTSWADAYTHPQVAMSAAVSGDEIWVAAGTYRPTGMHYYTLNLISGIGVYGGFAGTETQRDQRDWAANVTILSGDYLGDDNGFDNDHDNSYHVIYFFYTAVLDGFTVTGGRARMDYDYEPYGGGMLCLGCGSSPTVTNCTFTENWATDRGGAICVIGSNPTLTNCTFTGNYSGSGGGIFLGIDTHYDCDTYPTLIGCTFTGNSGITGSGVYCGRISGSDNVSPTLIDCTFTGNSSSSAGGGMYCGSGNGNSTLINCVFTENSATSYGGGMHNSGGSSTLINCILSGNSATSYGGGIHNSGGSSTLTNCAFSGNSAGSGGGIRCDNGTVSLENTIVWGNTGAPVIEHIGGSITAVYSCVEGGWSGSGNISDDPLFVDADGPDGIFGNEDDDLHLQPGTPCVDTGESWYLPNDTNDLDGDGNTYEWIPFDFDGNDRVVRSQVDMGPYEMQLWHVDDDALPGGDGARWGTAFDNLHDALAVARPGDEIWVADGTYKPAGAGGDRAATFQLINSVGIYGGFAGTETERDQRDGANATTILSGDLNGDDGPGFTNNGENSYHVVTGSGTDETAVLDRFTITSGNADGSSHTYGGGMYNGNGSPTLITCTFTGNSANSVGGGMYNSSSNSTLTNCTFSGNSSGNQGGGLYHNSTCNLTLVNCTFTGNSTGSIGGGIHSDGGSITLTNSAFTGNVACVGGGIFSGGSSVTLTNCTFAGNSAISGPGGGIFGGGDWAMTNCIFWGNTHNYSGTDEEAQIFGTPPPVISHSCIQGLDTFAGNNNIGDDPLFVDADGPDDIVGTEDDDLHLPGSSPCVDVADTAALPADTADLDGDGDTAEPLPLDLDENPRVINYVVDMGAYENTTGGCDGCLIDTVCYSNGDPNPANQCQYCDTGQSTSSWTNRSNGYACGDQSNTGCDNPNTCDGNGTCLDNFEPDTTECRAAVGDCDVAETCDGVGNCPADEFLPIDTPCGDLTSNGCTDPDTCDGTGTCLPNDQPNGTMCDDGLFCNENETCTDGVCGGGNANLCDDSLDCTTDTCNEDTGTCEHTTNAGTCLIDEVCYDDGAVNPANDCEECNSSLDQFDWSNRTNGTDCDDGLFCNENETCTDGVCGGGNANLCNDEQDCTADICNEDTDECEHVWNADLTLNVATGSECVDTDDTITVTLDVACLPEGVNGVQALIHYDTSLMTLVDIIAESSWEEIVEQDADGDIIWAAYIPGSSTATGGVVATLVFDPIAEGATNVTFQPDDPPFYTKLTRSADSMTILPDKADSGVISIDDTVATASNNGPFCEGDTIVLSGGPSSGPLGPYTYAWAGPDGFGSTEQSPTISDATLDMLGTYYLTVTNTNGCEFTAQTDVEVYLCMVVNVEIEGLIGDDPDGYGPPSSNGTEIDRDVTFVFTDCDGATGTHIIPITFTADVGNNKGVGSVRFEDLDAGFEWLGVQEGHTLRKRVAVDFVGTLADSVTVFLTSGDFHTGIVLQDNLVDIT